MNNLYSYVGDCRVPWDIMECVVSIYFYSPKNRNLWSCPRMEPVPKP